MKLCKANVIVPILHLLLLVLATYIISILRDSSEGLFWLFWLCTLTSFLLYFLASLSDPGFISKQISSNSKEISHHKQSSSLGSHQTAISAVKPINPSTNTSQLPQNPHIESFEGSQSGRVHFSCSSNNSYSQQFYQLSEGDLPNLQPVDLSVKIAISKEIPFKPEPASPAIYSQEDSEVAEIEEPERKIKITGLFCTACHNDQPIRAKHCSECKECVAMFDHHCPFLGICIGEKNRVVFFWLIFFQASECWIGLISCWKSLGPRKLWNIWLANNIQFIFLATLAFVLAILLTILLIYHFALACRNLTTWESMRWEKISYMAEQKSPPFSKGVLMNLLFYFKPHRNITLWQMPDSA